MSGTRNTNTNIDDYSIEDLLTILNIQNNTPTEFEIKDAANKIITQLKYDNKLNLAVFIGKARDKIIAKMSSDIFEEEDDEDNIQYDSTTQQGDWWKNEYVEQDDPVENTKPTNRYQKVDIFDKEGLQNNAFVMKKERLGVLQSHPIPVVQGTINPNLKNIIHRIVSIDSQYRSNIIPYSNNNVNAPSFNTDFSVDLSEGLINVLSMTLNSIQIPTSWYIFDDSLGNTCFKYKVNAEDPILVKIPSGNYTIPYLNTYFQSISIPLRITFDEVTGKLIFCTDLEDVTLIFYDTSTFNSCLDNSCGSSQMRINQNLGWSLGYRTNSETTLSVQLDNDINSPPTPPTNQLPPPLASTVPAGYVYYNIAQAPANLYGPAYFLLVVDDYNNNRVNNTLVSTTNVSTKLDLPSYYNSAVKNANNTFATVGCPDVLNTADPALNVPNSVLPYMTRSSPRQLTQSQLYTANEILYNRTTFTNKTVGPSSADVLALIPLNGIGALRTKIAYDAAGQVSIANSQFSQPYILFGPSIEGNTRTYFGPVDIDRMRVRLLDDKGNLVNLNDVDWSFSLLIEQLYQY
jgi:hypothetical protein